MKHFNIMAINEGTKEKENMFSSEINGGEMISFWEKQSVTVSNVPKRMTYYFLHSTSHFGSTSEIWISGFFNIAKLVFTVTDLKQK